MSWIKLIVERDRIAKFGLRVHIGTESGGGADLMNGSEGTVVIFSFLFQKHTHVRNCIVILGRIDLNTRRRNIGLTDKRNSCC